MKNLILIFFLLWGVKALNAQDSTCYKLNTLIQQSKKYNSQCTLKSSTYNMVIVMKTDTLKNIEIITTMNTGGKVTKVEKIFYCDDYYMRINGSEWRLMDSNVAKLQKSQGLSTLPQKQFSSAKNCKQLDDDLLNNEKCLVFTFETEQVVQFKATNIQTDSYVKMWITEQGLARKMITELDFENKKQLMEAVFEYDDIIIQAPIK